MASTLPVIVMPLLADVGASILVMVMIDAVLTRLFIVSGSPTMPLILLAAAVAVVWGR